MCHSEPTVQTSDPSLKGAEYGPVKKAEPGKSENWKSLPHIP